MHRFPWPSNIHGFQDAYSRPLFDHFYCINKNLTADKMNKNVCVEKPIQARYFNALIISSTDSAMFSSSANLLNSAVLIRVYF